jgi:hypothetical protein
MATRYDALTRQMKSRSLPRDPLAEVASSRSTQLTRGVRFIDRQTLCPPETVGSPKNPKIVGLERICNLSCCTRVCRLRLRRGEQTLDMEKKATKFLN